MHLPTQKFSNEISIDKGLFLDIANFIRQKFGIFERAEQILFWSVAK